MNNIYLQVGEYEFRYATTSLTHTEHLSIYTSLGRRYEASFNFSYILHDYLTVYMYFCRLYCETDGVLHLNI